MSAEERINALESLLARIQRNAAEPRPQRRTEPPARPTGAGEEVVAFSAPAASPGRYTMTSDSTARKSAPPVKPTTVPPLAKPATVPPLAKPATVPPAKPATVPPPRPATLKSMHAVRPPPPKPVLRSEPPPTLEVKEEILELDDLDLVFDEEERVRRASRTEADLDLELGKADRLKAEKERLAKEAAEKAERERLAKEAAEKAERERRAKEAAEKAERERRAKEAAEKAERERRAKEAAEKAERERRAKEAAEKAEKERLAKEAAEKAEKERLAKEAAEKAEEPAPASARQPLSKREVPVDEPFSDLLDEEEPPPESGEVASQRKPASTRGEVALADFEPASPVELPGPDVIRRPPPQGEAACFIEAARADRPATFGELLDLSLSL